MRDDPTASPRASHSQDRSTTAAAAGPQTKKGKAPKIDLTRAPAILNSIAMGLMIFAAVLEAVFEAMPKEK